MIAVNGRDIAVRCTEASLASSVLVAMDEVTWFELTSTDTYRWCSIYLLFDGKLGLIEERNCGTDFY